MRWVSVRTINAPPDRVFQTVADPEEFHRAIPDGVKQKAREKDMDAVKVYCER